MMEHAILDENNNIVKVTLQELMERDIGHVSTSVARHETPEYLVSTVFLSVALDGYWFETMVLDNNSDHEIQYRCKTYEEAVEQHYEVVGRMKESPEDPLRCPYSKSQLQFLGERTAKFDELDVVDQFTFMMLA